MQEAINFHIFSLLFFLGYKQQTTLHFVYDSVFSFAHALTKIQEEICGPGHVGLCHGFTPENILGSRVIGHLQNVSFIGMTLTKSV